MFRDPPLHSFTCPRCGMMSCSPDDVLHGYCGNCHADTGGLIPSWSPPHGQVPAALTPEVLLRHRGWHLAEVDEQTAVFTWDPVACPSPQAWAMSPELGYVQATSGRDRAPVIQVATRVFARLLADRVSESPAEYGWTLAARVHLADVLRRQGELPRMPPAETGLYQCPRCGFEMHVPPGHTGSVLCGRHEREMVIMTNISAPAWSRPDADVLGDLRQAMRHIEDYRNREMPAAVLAGQQMLYGTASEVQFAVSQDNGADVAAAARYFAGRCGPVDVSFALGGPLDIPFEIEAPGGRDETERYLTLRQAGFSSDEARSWAALGEAAAASAQSAAGLDRRMRQSLGLPPGWLPEASYIPDREPPRRPLPGTSAPSEGGEDCGTAARTLLSDYDDPERVFL